MSVDLWTEGGDKQTHKSNSQVKLLQSIREKEVILYVFNNLCI